MLVDVLLLRVVDAHERLDRLDDALGVADEVSIGVSGGETIRHARQQPGLMDDLAVRPAHCPEAVPVGQELGKARIDGGLILTLMRHDVLGDDAVGLANQRHGRRGFGVIERIGDLPQAVELDLKPLVIFPQLPRG